MYCKRAAILSPSIVVAFADHLFQFTCCSEDDVRKVIRLMHSATSAFMTIVCGSEYIIQFETKRDVSRKPALVGFASLLSRKSAKSTNRSSTSCRSPCVNSRSTKNKESRGGVKCRPAISSSTEILGRVSKSTGNRTRRLKRGIHILQKYLHTARLLSTILNIAEGPLVGSDYMTLNCSDPPRFLGSAFCFLTNFLHAFLPSQSFTSQPSFSSAQVPLSADAAPRRGGPWAKELMLEKISRSDDVLPISSSVQ